MLWKFLRSEYNAAKMHDEIKKFLEKLERLYENRYVSEMDLTQFLEKNPIPDFSSLKAEMRQKFWHGKLKDAWQLRHVLLALEVFLKKREKINQKFIKNMKKEDFKMDGCKLDPYQIAAVVAEEDATLILAPAGSGKTATLLAKVNYLVQHDHIPPEKILIIAFTNKVVDELKERSPQKDVEIRTFHSLGNKIIKEFFNNYRLLSENESEQMIKKIIEWLKMTNVDFAKKYKFFLEGPPTEGPTVIRQEANPDDVEELINSGVGLQKGERISCDELKQRIEKIKEQEKRKEALRLFEIYVPVYTIYGAYLKKRRFYDFADMLNLATEYIEKMPDKSFDYEYILVDEAQDLSKSKYLLLNALLKKCKKVKLFAVGDDWQSIYRFAGSNLKVLNDFEKIFGRRTYRGIIELTYRFGQPTARISNHFIQKNKYQSKKSVRPATNKYTPIEYIFNIKKPKKNVPPDYEAVNEKLQELAKKYGEILSRKRLQIISRYNRDIFRLVDQTTNEYKQAKYSARDGALVWKCGNLVLKIPFCTIHKAKGITRDIVFVINLSDAGIPASRDGNPMLETMLAEMDEYPFAEERRLFYVAITRAREKTILVADPVRPSKFLLELNPKMQEI